MAEVIQPESSAPPLNEVERVVDAFVAPSKTFTDIRRSASWWLPWLLGVIVTVAFGMVVQQKITWAKAYDNNLKQSPKQMERLEQQPVDAQVKAKAIGTNITKYIFFSFPVLGILIAVIAAGVLMVTVNFGFGGRAKFGQMMAVWFYATLPWAIQGILGIVTTCFVDPDAFNLNNFVGTNIGYYLPTDLPKPIIALGTAIDVFTIWALILMTIGIAIVGNIKKGQAATAGWGCGVIMPPLKFVGGMSQ